MNKESVLTRAVPRVRRPKVRVTLCMLSVAMSVLCAGVVSARAQDQENLANFGHIASAEPAPTKRVSLATVAPGLLPYFNNGPVFGLGGTVEGNFWHRTQLTGGWYGVRTDWTDHGIFLDIYSTSTYQNVTSGGLKTGSAFAQNTQLSLNNVSVGTTVSTQRATAIPNSNQGSANSCDVASTNTPASTSLPSLVDTLPNLLPLFNNGPVFGLPGTVEGDFWHRTQLIGDPNCKRADLARRGVFIDLYATTAYQDTTSGGLKTGNSIAQNTQLSINLDTGRARLWPGGLIHFTVQSRYGSSPSNTFTAGSVTPEYTGLELPGPLFWQDTLPSEYSLTQELSQKVDVILGKINGLFIADQTLFGNRFRYYFANSNFNKNPIYSNFFNTMTLSAVGVWTTTPWLTIAGGVHDPHTQPNTFASNAFHNGDVNLYLEGIFTYTVGGRPAQISPAFNWSNAPKIDLESPFGPLSPAQIPQAVNVLLGNDSPDGLPVNFKKRSFFTISNFSQYLFVKEEDPSEIADKLRTGQTLRGVGVFGRLGYAAPEALNTVNRDASVALLAEGLLGTRQYDSFGIGFYYNGISRDLKNSMQQLTDGTTVRNENGIEMFYNFAITPAINVNASYQYMWNPLVASVAVHQDHADLLIARLNLVW